MDQATRGQYAVLARVSPGYPPPEGRLVTCYSPVRHSNPESKLSVLVRLACVKHAASVRPEPGSNSPLKEKLVSSVERRSSRRSIVRNLRLEPTRARSAEKQDVVLASCGPAHYLKTSVFKQRGLASKRDRGTRVEELRTPASKNAANRGTATVSPQGLKHTQPLAGGVNTGSFGMFLRRAPGILRRLRRDGCRQIHLQPRRGWATGIEPATSGTTIRRSNRLSYAHQGRPAGVKAIRYGGTGKAV